MAMKYWNRRKHVRERCWIAVSWPTASTGLFVSELFLKRWCQQQPSSGKFFIDYNHYKVWFEDYEDASWFILNWS